ncbi:stAR-related lipid transfer protein 7, mitochondrial isoform X2 [Folsomia candida]|uniref:Phosphatidylcholine transfer protein n=1 Tax=Folsomia candida TaxID=158441 RepID=A0A226DCS7_FOLCA|nr:stAR-related lipid transfer protein 7, mitochondrial isoform X2 [Folsomia candida]OXA43375.1 StAR-related lipid transfer protein 7, mitochondrial [Folsomia candida]
MMPRPPPSPSVSSRSLHFLRGLLADSSPKSFKGTFKPANLETFLNRVYQSRPNYYHYFPSASKITTWATDFRHGLKIMGSFVGKECSPIFAQRVFRTCRVIQLHSKLWSNHLNRFRGPLGRQALLSFLLVSLCDANPRLGESILNSELVEHMKDLDFIHELTSATVVCPHCQDRLVVDKKIPNVKYCHCPDAQSAYDRKVKGYAWTPFVETADLLIWRMPHPDRPGLFMYKVYGYYDDISAEDFLNTQLDIEYRKGWDDTVLKLNVVESSPEISQDVIYWEMKWPTMFSNRDYLFARRHLVDRQKKTIVIISKAVPHPAVPDKKGVHRVKEYWSVMQVNAVNGLSEPGVEFGLTYFDNPGVSLPQWMQNWASMTAIPEFLDKQRNAARAKKNKSKKSSTLSKSSPILLHKCSDDSDAGGKNSTTKATTPIPSSTSQLISQETTSSPPSSDSRRDKEDADLKILSQYFKENILPQTAPQ